ncbi:hypothetical protein [Streptomyces violaceusniger]|uniref:hypothetical protein n=1 Tax=Streptomyces violaceusniger TaxID=68280 RepID=UPI0036A15077
MPTRDLFDEPLGHLMAVPPRSDAQVRQADLLTGHEEGMADPVFLEAALDEPLAGPQPPTGMPAELAQLLGSAPSAPDPEAAARARELRAELASAPVELIRLTDLGTRCVRQRLIAQGRSAPLVGELTHAPAAGLLGVLAQEYDPAATAQAAPAAAHRPAVLSRRPRRGPEHSHAYRP